MRQGEPPPGVEAWPAVKVSWLPERLRVASVGAGLLV